jgi:hypothetical protein
MTEWLEFADFDWTGRGKELLASPAIVDFRNLLDPVNIRRAGFNLKNLGRK